jgi:predicted TPR repeat methyltransferase
MSNSPRKTSDPTELFRRAADLHRNGNFAAAASLYLQTLKSWPNFLPALLSYAVVLQALNRPAEALATYDKALAINPRNPGALYNRGNALRDLNRAGEAIASYDRALKIKPGFPEAYNNRGSALRDLDRIGEALVSFDKALAIKPDYAEALNNRGNALRDLKRTDEAIASYDRALATKPTYTYALYNRGSALRDLNRIGEALASFDEALTISPCDAQTLYSRGNALRALERPAEALMSYDKALRINPGLVEAWHDRAGVLHGLSRHEEAIAAYRQALAKGGDPEAIQYALASLGVEAAPLAAPKEFVTNLFDQGAERFEELLIGKLKYQAPELLFELVARHDPGGNLDILDLGCGTGLLGARLHPFARTLTGVDLSSNMLKLARKRQIYDNLICGELVEFLLSGKTKRFDLVVATDVFIYIGDLSQVFQGVRSALREGGLFCFSVEASEEQEFVLTAACRYAHSITYLETLAKAHGFVLDAIDSGVLRKQAGSDVGGYFIMLRCP